MTDAEFRVVREFLGVADDLWLAGHLEVSPHAVRDWEDDTRVVFPTVCA